MPTLIDLRQSQDNQPATGKQLIINVLGQLVEHTEKTISASIGEEKKKHQFRVTQFKKAISSLRSYRSQIRSGRQARELPGIGKGIGDRIDEIIETGTLSELAEELVIDENTRLVNELMTVTGIGEANAKKFIEMGVTGLNDLKKKYDAGKIMLTHHMRVGLKYYQDFQQRIPRQEIVELEQYLRVCVREIHPDVLVEVCGSYRRQRPTSGDIDVLITHQSIGTDDDLITSQTHYLKDIVKRMKQVGFVVDDLTSQGDTKYMGVCVHPAVNIGRRIDIRFVTYDSYFPAILYFTGSGPLNRIMRTYALKKHYTLNEYGLYRADNEKIPVHSEKEIFDLLGLSYLEPTEREL
jgi:DNA polymerase beta